MALPYQYQTLAQARQSLANRLYDSSMVFWSSAELTLYIQEALQTFNSLAQFWRGDFVFPTAANITWYDLTQVANTLRPYTVTDQSLYTIMEYQLLEPVLGNFPASGTPVWTGTGMFSISDFVQAVERRRNELLGITGCTITRSTIAALTGQVRNFVDDYVIDIRRVAWFPTPISVLITGNTTTNSNVLTGVSNTSVLAGSSITGSGIPANTTISDVTLNNQIVISNNATLTATGVLLTVTPQPLPNVLWPEDQWAFQAFESGYTEYPQDTPSTYAISTEPPLSFDTDVAPNSPGSYEILSVNAGTVLSTAAPTIIDIPADFCWILKYGALADLLSKESEAKDAGRAKYCNMRYEQGLQLLKIAPAALQIRVNNAPVWIDAVRSADEYNTTWQAEPAGAPANVYAAGLNLIGLNPTPNSINYSITATVVVNAPIPVNNTDPIQVARDDYDVIIDMAQHIALLKNGGAEFSETIALYNRFVQQAARYNSKLTELGCFKEAIVGSSQREEVMNPRYTKSLTDIDTSANANSGGGQS